MKTVLLASTAHPANDPRIAYKVAPALAEHYRVVCALPRPCSDLSTEIPVEALPRFRRLLPRIAFTYPMLCWIYLRHRPAIVHFFVPELIPIALIFNALGSKVIFEVQENFYKKFEIKQFNKAHIYQWFFRYFDRIARRKFHFIFTDDSYLNTYPTLAFPHAIVHNFPDLRFIDQWKNGAERAAIPEFVYAGVISLERSLDVVLLALQKVKTQIPDFRMHFFGPLRISEKALHALPGYQSVVGSLHFYGSTDQKIWLSKAAHACAGIALLKPVADYPESYTTKLFEYMALGIPVVTSDFPLYREVVERSECGFCISPYNADELAEKLLLLAVDRERGTRLGENGRKAVEKSYRWDTEKQNLLSYYENLFK